MKISMYQVDAFASEVFTGNPAAVCVLDEWLDDEVLQNIAAENNLAETAFFIKTEAGYDLRWFTPAVEIDLCGHATLASAYVIFEYLEPKLRHVSFSTMSGQLDVTMNGSKRLSMDFPARAPKQIEITDLHKEAFGLEPLEVWQSRDLVVLLESETQIKNLDAKLDKIAQIDDSFAVIATAKGDKIDFVSRFFAPNAGIPEDPVTGSAHCTLVPFWAEKLGKTTLHARQLSPRGGELFCEHQGDRVSMSGYATLFMKGEVYL